MITDSQHLPSVLRAVLSLFVLLLTLGDLTCASSIFGKREMEYRWNTLTTIAWGEPEPKIQHNELESISGLMYARGGSEAKALVNAKRILHDLSASPSCAYEPTARLLRQCKAIKPRTKDPASDLQKSNVQATYGITMALCEARQARVSVPRSCHVFESLLSYDIPSHSVEIIRASDIESCMNAIYESSLWTSYTTFRIQSKDLCDTSRVDYQREELLETFRQATNVVPEVLAALKEHQAESMTTVQALQDLSTELSEAQERMIASSNEQAVKAKEQLDQIAQYVESYMQLIDESGKTWQTNLKDGVEQASQDMALMNNRANSMQARFSELYAQALEAMSGTTHNFESSVGLMATNVENIVKGLIDLDPDGNFEKVRQTLALGQHAATEFARTQKQQYDMTQQHLTLGKDLLSVIKDSHGHFHQIKETLDLFPNSWFETLHQVHAKVVRFKDELKYSLAFLIPSMLMLLLGRIRTAAIISLSYALFRTVLSVIRSLHVEKTNLPISSDDLKLLFICSFGAICAGASAACVASFCLNFFRTYRRKPARDLEDNICDSTTPSKKGHLRNRSSTVYSNNSIHHRGSSIETTTRSRSKQPLPDSDRFIRSATVPFDFAPQ